MQQESKELFFKKMKDKEMTITEEDFFNVEENQRYMWLSTLIVNKEIQIMSDGENFNFTYIKESKQRLEEIKQKLVNNNFNLKEAVHIKELIDNEVFEKRLNVLKLFFEKEEEINPTKLEVDITEIFQKQVIISELLRAEKYFNFKQEQEELKSNQNTLQKIYNGLENLHTLDKELHSQPMNVVLKNKELYEKLKPLHDEIKPYLQYIESNLFNIFYQYYLQEEKKNGCYRLLCNSHSIRVYRLCGKLERSCMGTDGYV